MFNIGAKLIEELENFIEQMFDESTIKFLGIIPKSTREKRIVFKVARSSLTSLFLQSIGNRKPSEMEEDVLKQNLRVAKGYLDALKLRTKSNVSHSVKSVIDDSLKSTKKIKIIKKKKIIEAYQKEIDKAKTHLELILITESNKMVNTGTAMQIMEVAKSNGIVDPTVFFVTSGDNRVCSECKRLHLLSDEITPRVWKMSEVGSGYHKKGDNSPKINGLHPRCFTEDQLLYTKKGLYTFKELFESQDIPCVLVDRRVRNRKSPNNQLGSYVPGEIWIDQHSVEKNGRFLESTPVYYTGEQEVLKIYLANGLDIEVTEKHEMLYKNKKQAYVKINADELCVGDLIPLSSSECFGDLNFPEEAELMGNLLGDGVLNEKTDWATWHFFGNDLEYGKKMWEIRNNVLDRVGVPNTKERPKINPPNEKYNVSHMMISSQVLGKLFKEKYGLSKKPRRVPEKIFKANKSTVSAFLRGLYSADGYINSENSISISQNNLEFLKQIQILLSMFSINGRIYKHDNECEKDIKYANGNTYTTKRKATWRLVLGGYKQTKKFIDEIGFGQNKHNLDEKTQKPNTIRGNWVSSKIIKIERIGKKKTYCLTEPMTNTVVVNGIITGQCRCKITLLMPNFSFTNGKISFKELGWDEFEAQRKTDPLKKSHPQDFYPTTGFEHGDEHPENKNMSNKLDHRILHVAKNGQKFWQQKYLPYAGKTMDLKQSDQYHRDIFKKFMNDKKVKIGSDYHQNLVGLNKHVVNDPDRFLKPGNTSFESGKNHSELRHRHLVYAFEGRPGYKISEHDGGVMIVAPRHHMSGDNGTTVWHWKNNSLKTLSNKVQK